MKSVSHLCSPGASHPRPNTLTVPQPLRSALGSVDRGPRPVWGGPRFNPAAAPLGNAPAPPGALTSLLIVALRPALEPGPLAPLVWAASGPPPRLGSARQGSSAAPAAPRPPSPRGRRRRLLKCWTAHHHGGGLPARLPARAARRPQRPPQSWRPTAAKPRDWASVGGRSLHGSDLLHDLRVGGGGRRPGQGIPLGCPLSSCILVA